VVVGVDVPDVRHAVLLEIGVDAPADLEETVLVPTREP
jgi:hypothetical protein